MMLIQRRRTMKIVFGLLAAALAAVSLHAQAQNWPT
jgi:hypothetical protein